MQFSIKICLINYAWYKFSGSDKIFYNLCSFQFSLGGFRNNFEFGMEISLLSIAFVERLISPTGIFIS